MLLDYSCPSSEPHLFKINLDKYYGPLDLLLYLLRKNELQIHEISIVRIADQFKEFIVNLNGLNLLKLEVASEFLVMASRLMEMKSRLLLPESQDPETDSEVQNPHGSYTNVIQQLLEYKHIKEAAERLEAQAEAYHTRYSRWDDKASAESPPSHVVRIHPVELWDLIAAFARILREIQPAETPSIQMDDVPQQVYEKEIIQLLKRTSPIKFIDIFQPPYVRLRLIGIFLALLELIRRCLVEVSNDHEGTIFLSLKEPEKQGA